MVVSKRERFLVIATASVVAILGFDKLIFSPLMEARAEVATQITDVSDKLDKATKLFNNSNRAGKRLHEMAGKQLAGSASEAEGQILHSVRDWAQDAGVELSSVKPERSEKERDFNRISFRATGIGNMNQLGRFLFHIQSANVPVRVTDLSITSRKEGTDDLSMQVGIATIHTLSVAETPAGREGAR